MATCTFSGTVNSDLNEPANWDTYPNVDGSDDVVIGGSSAPDSGSIDCVNFTLGFDEAIGGSAIINASGLATLNNSVQGAQINCGSLDWSHGTQSNSPVIVVVGDALVNILFVDTVTLTVGGTLTTGPDSKLSGAGISGNNAILAGQLYLLTLNLTGNLTIENTATLIDIGTYPSTITVGGSATLNLDISTAAALLSITASELVFNGGVGSGTYTATVYGITMASTVTGFAVFTSVGNITFTAPSQLTNGDGLPTFHGNVVIEDGATASLNSLVLMTFDGSLTWTLEGSPVRIYCNLTADGNLENVDNWTGVYDEFLFTGGATVGIIGDVTSGTGTFAVIAVFKDANVGAASFTCNTLLSAGTLSDTMIGLAVNSSATYLDGSITDATNIVGSGLHTFNTGSTMSTGGGGPIVIVGSVTFLPGSIVAHPEAVTVTGALDTSVDVTGITNGAFATFESGSTCGGGSFGGADFLEGSTTTNVSPFTFTGDVTFEAGAIIDLTTTYTIGGDLHTYLPDSNFAAVTGTTYMEDGSSIASGAYPNVTRFLSGSTLDTHGGGFQFYGHVYLFSGSFFTSGFFTPYDDVYAEVDVTGVSALFAGKTLTLGDGGAFTGGPIDGSLTAESGSTVADENGLLRIGETATFLAGSTLTLSLSYFGATYLATYIPVSNAIITGSADIYAGGSIGEGSVANATYHDGSSLTGAGNHVFSGTTIFMADALLTTPNADTYESIETFQNLTGMSVGINLTGNGTGVILTGCAAGGLLTFKNNARSGGSNTTFQLKLQDTTYDDTAVGPPQIGNAFMAIRFYGWPVDNDAISFKGETFTFTGVSVDGGVVTSGGGTPHDYVTGSLANPMNALTSSMQESSLGTTDYTYAADYSTNTLTVTKTAAGIDTTAATSNTDNVVTTDFTNRATQTTYGDGDSINDQWFVEGRALVTGGTNLSISSKLIDVASDSVLLIFDPLNLLGIASGMSFSGDGERYYFGSATDLPTGLSPIGDYPDAGDVRSGQPYAQMTMVGSMTVPDVPASSDVRNGVGSGTLVVPDPDDVRAGTHFDSPDLEGGSIGTLAVPSAANTLFGVNVDDTVGTYHGTTAGNVRATIPIGTTTGTLAVPSAANTLFGVDVDNTTGTYKPPVRANVRNGINVGITTGTLVVPPANKVSNDTTYDNGTVGTLDPGSGGSGADRHHYYVRANGDDSDAGTLEAPFETMAKAVEVAIIGDTIQVLDDTPAENAGQAAGVVIISA